MPKPLWEELNKRPRVLPLPTPDTAWNPKSNDGAVRYLDYHKVKYLETVPNHRPSYKPPPTGKAMEALDKALSEATRPSGQSKGASLWHKNKVRHFVICQNCDKRRVIFAWPIIGENIGRRVEDLDGLLAETSYGYNCGDALFGLEEEPVPHPQDLSIFHVRRSLSCGMPQEASYYSSAKFQPICAHCAREDEHVPAQEVALKTDGRKAYSICRSCFDEKKMPLLYGQKIKTGNMDTSHKRAQKTEHASSSKKKKAKTSPVIPSWASSKQLKAPLAEAAATTTSNLDTTLNSRFDSKASSQHKDPRKWFLGETLEEYDWKKDMKKFGTIEDVWADGNCGFYAIMLGLEKIGKIERGSVTVTEFRKELREYGTTNEKQIRDEALPESQKMGVSNAISWRTDVLDPLFREGRNYEPGGRLCDWICGHWHFPLIAYKFQINIVVYSTERRTTVTKPTESDWLTRRLAHPCSLACAPWSVDIASTIFLVHKNGCHYLHLSVPLDIQEPSAEEDKLMEEEEPEQRDKSNPISDSELVGSTTI
jgi:hypothetical protein